MELGYPHPDHLLNNITSSQLSEWIAYDRLDPIGKQREDFRFAHICSVIVNIARGVWGKKGSKKTTPKDFMPIWDAESKKAQRPKQSVEEMKDILYAIAGKSRKK